MAHGKIMWTELNTHKPADAAAFYERTLGWRIETIERGPLPPYRVGWVGEEMAAGIFDLSELGPVEVPAHWMTYFEVADCDAMVADVKAAGGAVIREPFDVPQVGRFAILHDAVGAVYGVLQPEPESTE